MELPAEVMIHNEILGMKGKKGTLLQISPHGYYEINTHFGEQLHRVLLPILATVLISSDPETAVGGAMIEVER